MPVVAIIGSGLIGRAWANVFARAGWQVRLWDPEPRRRATAPRPRRAALHELARMGWWRIPRPRPRARLATSPDLAQPLRARFRSGERPRDPRGQESTRSPGSTARAAGQRARFVDLGDRRLALHRAARRPRRAASSGIRSIRPTWCRSSSSAAHLDFEPTREPRARSLRERRPGAGRRAARGRRLHPQPAAGRPAGRSLPAGRRGLLHAPGSGQDPVARASAGAGRSWGRSRRSSSMRPAAFRTTARATPVSTGICRPNPPRRGLGRAELVAGRRGAGAAHPPPTTSPGKTSWRNERLAALAAHLDSQQPWKK